MKITLLTCVRAFRATYVFLPGYTVGAKFIYDQPVLQHSWLCIQVWDSYVVPFASPDPSVEDPSNTALVNYNYQTIYSHIFTYLYDTGYSITRSFSGVYHL